MLVGDGATQPSANKVAPENAKRLRTVLVRPAQVLIEIAPDLIDVLVPGAALLAVLGKATATKARWMDQVDRLVRQPAAPAADQSHILEQYTAFLRRLSAKTPLILFLDDLFVCAAIVVPCDDEEAAPAAQQMSLQGPKT